MDLSRSPRKKMQAVLGQYHRSGFSLVEVLVAAMLLAISASAAVTLFSTSKVLFTKGEIQDSDQIAINEDLAIIQQHNRRFTCMEGSCALSSSDPNEDQYTPDHPDKVPPDANFVDKMSIFSSKCKQPEGDASGLLKEFEIVALKTLPAMERGIARNVYIDIPAKETPTTPHAYIVIYSKQDPDGNTQILRRARFVPTVAGWCP